MPDKSSSPLWTGKTKCMSQQVAVCMDYRLHGLRAIASEVSRGYCLYPSLVYINGEAWLAN